MKSKMTWMLILTSALVLGGCSGSEERKAAHMEKGKALLAGGNYDKARVEFSNVLQIDPTDNEARLELAQTYEKLADWRNAAAHYLRIIENDPAHVRARIRMGQIYALGRVYDKGLAEVEEVLKREPDNADALALRGGIRAQQGDAEAAARDAQAALGKDPHHVNATALMASLFLQKKETDKAIALLKQALDHNPDNASLRTMLGRLYAETGKTDKALDMLREIVQREPEVLAHRVQLAGFLIARNRLDEAEQALREAVGHSPGDVKAKLAFAEFLAGRRDRAKAETALRGWLTGQPGNYELMFALAGLHESAGEVDKAKSVYAEIVAKDEKSPNALRAKTRMAAMSLRQNDTAQAEALIAEVLQENARDKDALMLRGQIALARQDYATAISDFRAALRDDPGSARLQRLLARAHFLNKETDLARDTLKKAIEGTPEDMQLRSDYMQLLAQSGDMKGVVDQLQEVLRISPDNFGALETLFKAHAITQDWTAARQIAERLKEKYADKPHGHYFAGLVHQAQNDAKASLGDFEMALERAPEAIEPLTQLIKSHLALGQKEQAIARLDQTLSGQARHFVALNLKGELLLADKKVDEAVATFNQAIDINPKWPVPYGNLALAHQINKNVEAATEVYKKGIAATSNSPVLITGLASLYEQQGNYDSAIAQYESVLQEAPDALVAANNLAVLLVEHKKDPVSLSRALKLIEPLKGSRNAAYLDTVGWVQYRAGEVEAAIPNLEQAVDSAPNTAVLRYHLGMVYLKKGDTGGAREQLRKALEQTAPFPGAEEARAALAQIDAG